MAAVEFYDHFDGRHCLYVLLVEPTFYKFGITSQISTRLHTHFRDMKFIETVRVYDCTHEKIMRDTETLLKKFAKTNDTLVTKYDKTEIIHTDNIRVYLDYIAEVLRGKMVLVDGTAPVVIQPEVIQIRLDKHKCDKCEKVFATDQGIERHKDRKVPCGIQDIKIDQLNNPNRCIHCNMILSKKEHLTRHLKICKIKDIQVYHPVEKRLNQDVKLLKEQQEIITRREDEHLKIIQLLEAKVKQLEIQFARAVAPIVVNNYINTDRDNKQ